jgi:predicted ABC-class ATPase
MDKTGLLPELWNTRVKKIALEDYFCRQFNRAIGKFSRRRRGIGKSGLIAIDCNKQYVLERNSVLITDQTLDVRFVVGLPAQGRTILGSEVISLFLQQIPQIAEQGLFLRNLNVQELKTFIKTAEDQEAIRQCLNEKGMVAFVADGSILPRRSGVDDRPLLVNPVPFYSPDELAVNVDLPHRGAVRGMGVPPGVTLIVGGGFHGKSTLLNALEVGVYNHIPGDGREYVITHRDSVKIRAENGRSIQQVNISSFISNLPLMRDTSRFSTENGSGSTSQAASIIEALESGARVLLIDEDTSATNFMIRDERMQELVVKEKEPITPFVDKVEKMYRECSVSTVLVMGGSGDYFDVADTVIMMDEYRPRAVSKKAKEIASRNGLQRKDEGGDSFGEVTPRKPTSHSFDASRGRKDVKIDVKGLHGMLYGETFVDLSALEQLLDSGQTRCIGLIIYYYAQHYRGSSRNLTEGLRQVMQEIKEKGLDTILPFKTGNLALPRIFEVAGAINRMRSLRIE